MADVKISQLPASTTPLDGTEVLPIVQSATTKQVSVANLTAGRAVSALSLSLTNALPVTSGGTGIQAAAQGSLLSATGANTFSATVTPTLGLAGTSAGTLGLSGSTSGVVTLQTAAAAGTWSMTLPTSGGTNGYILTTNGAGVTSWTNPTALGVDLDVGGTAITGGTSGRVLYDNAGVLGEYAVTGTGSVVLGTTPTFTTSALFPAGTVGAPGISVSGDTNTGIYFPAADTIGFVEGGVEAMRLDSSGNLGLGVTPSAWSSSFKALQINTLSALWGSGTATFLSTNVYNNGANNVYIGNNYASRYYQLSGAHIWDTAPSGSAGGTISFTQAMTLDASGNLGVGTVSPAQRLHIYKSSYPILYISDASYASDFGIDSGTGNFSIGNNSNAALTFKTNSTERARIDASGNLLVGTTSNVAGGKLTTQFAGSTFYGLVSNATASSGTRYHIGFYENGTERGGVTTNGSVTTYGGTSDYRLKENITPISNGLARVLSMKPSKYTWKDSGDDCEGFIAHELAEIFPYAVVGEKDGPKMQMVDYGKLTPLLTAAIQELAAKVSALEARQ